MSDAIPPSTQPLYSETTEKPVPENAGRVRDSDALNVSTQSMGSLSKLAHIVEVSI